MESLMSRAKRSPSKDAQAQLDEQEARLLGRTSQLRSGPAHWRGVPGPLPTSPEQRQTRLHKLSGVFKVFDLDESGAIESAELLQLGKMRRQLAQKSGDWDEAKNAKLVKKIDANADGTVSDSEFSEFFEKSLTKDAVEFDLIVRQFMQVAQVCRQRKREAKIIRQKTKEKAGPSQSNRSSAAAGASKDAKWKEREDKLKLKQSAKQAAASQSAADTAAKQASIREREERMRAKAKQAEADDAVKQAKLIQREQRLSQKSSQSGAEVAAKLARIREREEKLLQKAMEKHKEREAKRTEAHSPSSSQPDAADSPARTIVADSPSLGPKAAGSPLECALPCVVVPPPLADENAEQLAAKSAEQLTADEAAAVMTAQEQAARAALNAEMEAAAKKAADEAQAAAVKAQEEVNAARNAALKAAEEETVERAVAEAAEKKAADEACRKRAAAEAEAMKAIAEQAARAQTAGMSPVRLTE